MSEIFDCIVIGGGPAGYSSALYACRAGLSTLVIEKMSPGGQMTLTGDIENYPGFDNGIDGFTLGMQMQKGAEKFGAKTVYADVLSVNLSGEVKTITVSGSEFFAKSVIIATGATPRKLGLTDEATLTGRGVHYCAHCDGRFYKDKIVAVVGGGNSAVSDALYLSNLCKRVYLIHRRDSLRASKVYHRPLENTENIEILWDSSVTAFLKDVKVFGIEIKNLKTNVVQELSVDGVFVSIGREPATTPFVGQVDIDSYGYIVADETTKTSVEGVFAAGDVRTKALRQVVTAAADGAVSAYFAEEYLGNF